MTEIRGLDRDVYLRLLKHIEDRMKNYPVDGTRDEKWAFYSDLDDSYRQPWIVDSILDWLWHPNLILTGQFGWYVIERIEKRGEKRDYILFNGKLREGKKPRILMERHCSRNPYEEDYYPTYWLLDDSNYSGRTRFVIDSFLRENYDNTKLTNTIVIYNGASRFHPHINALYSWYMIHGLEGWEE